MKNLFKCLFVAAVMMTLVGCGSSKDTKEIDYSYIPFATHVNEREVFLGYLDSKGNEVIAPRFDDAWAFSNGLAQVLDPSNRLRGFIDKSGSYVIPPIYDAAGMFFDERAFVHEPGHPIVCINTAGETVFELPDVVEAGFFSEGLAPVCNTDRKWGFVNTKGEMVIMPQFDYAGTFSDKLAVVRLGEKFGYINHEGHFVINPQFAEAEPFACGKAFVKKSSYSKERDCVNTKGDILPNERFGSAYYVFSENLIICTDKDCSVIKNIMGRKLATSQRFTSVGIFSEGLCQVTHEKKYGYIDKKGIFAINPIYDGASNFHDGVAIVTVDKNAGLINKDGKYIIEPKFMFLGSFPHYVGGSSEGYLKNRMAKYWCRMDSSKKR